MYHSEDSSVTYSSFAMHHRAFMSTTGIALLEYVDDILQEKGRKLPIVCADFGTADGGLAIQVCKSIISHLKRNGISDRQLLTLVLNDTQENDFNFLAKTIADAGLLQTTEVAVLMNCKSMYEKCLPDESVDLVLCVYALHFAEKHLQIKGELFMCCKNVTDEEKNEARKHGLQNWCRFLDARNDELKSGGYILANIPEDGQTARGTVMQMMSDVLKQMVRNQHISVAEFQNTTHPFIFLSLEDYLSVFNDNKFKRLQLISRNVFPSEAMDFSKRASFSGSDVTKDVKMKEFANAVVNNAKTWSYNYLKESFQQSRSVQEATNLVDQMFELLKEEIINKLAIETLCRNIPYDIELVLKKE